MLVDHSCSNRHFFEMKKLAIIIPAYKEGENLTSLCIEILKYSRQADILVVDDSPDEQSVKAIVQLNHPQIKLIHRREKGGRGSAVILGISELIKSGYEYILEMDADFSHPPSQIPSLLEFAQERQLDLTIASRYLLESRIENWPLSRRLFSKAANIVAKVLLRVPVTDYTNGFRLYSLHASREISSTCGQLGSGFIALSEILVNLHYRGYKVGEVPTVFTNRVRGESSLSRKEIWSALVGLKKIYFLKRKLIR
jgi:dolichol-phosphate mannosyltransferase